MNRASVGECHDGSEFCWRVFPYGFMHLNCNAATSKTYIESYCPPKVFICQYQMKHTPWNNLESVLRRFVSSLLASF